MAKKEEEQELGVTDDGSEAYRKALSDAARARGRNNKAIDPNAKLDNTGTDGGSGGSDDDQTVKPSDDPQPQNKTTETTEYDDLRNQNYKNLLDTQIQLAAAQQAARKSASQSLAASGMLGTGYAGVAQNGLENAYINAMNEANQSYADTDIDISATERNAEKEEASNTFSNITTLLTDESITSVDDMNEVLNGYGITVSDDGTFSGDYYDKLTDEQKKQLQIIYNLYSNQYKYGGVSFGDSSSMLNGITMENGEPATQGNGWGIQDEISYLWANQGKYAKEGMVVKLTNGKTDTNCAYVVYHNGKWHRTTADMYGSATNKAEIKGGIDVSVKAEQEVAEKKAAENQVYKDLLKGKGIDKFNDWESLKAYCEENKLTDEQIKKVKKIWDDTQDTKRIVEMES